MSVRRLALGVLLALGACANPADQARELADRACACKSASCADRAQSDLAAFMRQHEGQTVSHQDLFKVTLERERLEGCVERARAEDPAVQAAKARELEEMRRRIEHLGHEVEETRK